jgi:hypothetical protein
MQCSLLGKDVHALLTRVHETLSNRVLDALDAPKETGARFQDRTK